MKFSALGLSLIAAALMFTPTASAQATDYEVTITNITAYQIISPPVVVSHRRSTDIFEVGQPASAELTVLAEDGDTSMLEAALQADPNVVDYAVGGGALMPGASMTLTVRAGSRSRISAVGMLVTTNDTFFGLDSLPAGAFTVMVPGYDAGTETNNEDCAFIPGPPCGNGFVRDTANAEGFIHIQRGIHGVGTLDAATYDWRNPVVKISVRPKIEL